MAENGCVPGASSLEWVRVAAHKWRFSCQRQTDWARPLASSLNLSFITFLLFLVFGLRVEGRNPGARRDDGAVHNQGVVERCSVLWVGGGVIAVEGTQLGVCDDDANRRDKDTRPGRNCPGKSSRAQIVEHRLTVQRRTLGRQLVEFCFHLLCR